MFYTFDGVKEGSCISCGKPANVCVLKFLHTYSMDWTLVGFCAECLKEIIKKIEATP